ncbi:MAG TPA: type II toxin-antitoxin system CcdA family antitoxin [Gammaproteobacteria bacterium]|jgi:antitoxin CcdA
MFAIYDHRAPKKPTNLSLNSDLLRKAKMLNINLSAAVEQALAEIVRNHQQEQWLAANQEAIDIYNQQVEQHGTFSDGLRSF